jgi:excisionase family DNA binding protein
MEEKTIHREFSQVMDIKELSEYLSIGKSKIYSLIRLKKIPASRIGRQYRFSKVVIDSWLREKLITEEDETPLPLFSEEKKVEN